MAFLSHPLIRQTTVIIQARLFMRCILILVPLNAIIPIINNARIIIKEIPIVIKYCLGVTVTISCDHGVTANFPFRKPLDSRKPNGVGKRYFITL